MSKNVQPLKNAITYVSNKIEQIIFGYMKTHNLHQEKFPSIKFYRCRNYRQAKTKSDTFIKNAQFSYDVKK